MATESMEVFGMFPIEEPIVNDVKERVEKYADISDVINSTKESMKYKKNLLVNLLNDMWKCWYISKRYGG